MTTQEGTVLFDGRDSRIALLNEVFGGLPQTRQIECLVSALRQREVWEAGTAMNQAASAISLVEALEKLWIEDGVAFRAQLMELCNTIPMQVEGNYDYQEQREFGVVLKLGMLSKIIEGWIPPSRFGEPLSHQVQGDAAVCFQFLCDSYEKAPPYQRWGNYPNPYAQEKEEPGRIRKGILELLREHLETHRLPLDELDIRVARPAPDPIKMVLCHARVRQAGMRLLIEEAAKRLQIQKA